MPGIIPLPTWLPTDAELERFREMILEVAREADAPDDGRGDECLAAIEAELASRGRPVHLAQQGVTFLHGRTFDPGSEEDPK